MTTHPIDPRYVPILCDVLQVLDARGGGPIDQAAWLNKPNRRLGRRTPIDLVNEGDGDRVLDVARSVR